MNKNISKPKSPHRPDLLGRAFLDILAREAGSSSRPLLRSGDPDDPIEKLLDDLAAADDTTSRISIRADLAAVAILTARAIDGEPGLVTGCVLAKNFGSCFIGNGTWKSLVY